MDEDPVFGELKESLKYCREKIRKQMKNENFVVTTVTWDMIWAKMRNSWKVSSRVKNQLKCWFQLWKEFPTERPRDDDANPVSSSHTKDDLYVVQPGDLWMDCGSPKQTETVSRANSIMSIDSVPQNKPGQEGEGVTLDEKLESSASSISDIPGLDVRSVVEYDDFPLPKTKPWWISMQVSPVQSTKTKGASPNQASSKSLVQKNVTGQRCRGISTRGECKKEQPSSDLPENSYFLPRSKTAYRAGAKNCKERKCEGCEIDPLKQQGSSRRLSKSVQIHKRETKKRQSIPTKQKTRTKPEPLSSDGTPKSFCFPPKDYVYEKGDWVVHAIMSSFSKPEDLKVALRERGYELKHIFKRECTLPKKWICSLIASADRTHIITSENIWLKGWEVDFVCNEEDISPFLVD